MLPRAAFAIPSAAVYDRLALGPALLATLAYHDLLELPLTAVQLWRYLLRPRSTRGRGGESVSGKAAASSVALSRSPALALVPSLRDVEPALADLVAEGAVETRNGFYFLPGRGGLFEQWIEKHERSVRKWKRLKWISYWLQGVPFLRGIAATGSLAFDNTKESSDLDVLVIAAAGRVWTVRFLLTVLLDLFGLRRRPQGPTRDRLCLNHYLSEDALEFPYRSLYTALEYARLVPVLGEEACRVFRTANRAWLEAYLVQVFPDTVTHRHTVPPSPVLRAIQWWLEFPLRTPLGGLLEGAVARVQRQRIARGAAGIPGRVVATAARAEFHPHSREASLLRAFNARMEELELADLFGGQQDSGLV